MRKIADGKYSSKSGGDCLGRIALQSLEVDSLGNIADINQDPGLSFSPLELKGTSEICRDICEGRRWSKSFFMKKTHLLLQWVLDGFLQGTARTRLHYLGCEIVRLVYISELSPSPYNIRW